MLGFSWVLAVVGFEPTALGNVYEAASGKLVDSPSTDPRYGLPTDGAAGEASVSARAVTFSAGPPRPPQALEGFLPIEELTSYVLSEEELQKMPQCQ